jgi:hypothetical protein
MILTSKFEYTVEDNAIQHNSILFHIESTKQDKTRQHNESWRQQNRQGNSDRLTATVNTTAGSYLLHWTEPHCQQK